MSDQDIIDAAAEVQCKRDRTGAGFLISDLQAKVIANAWHGGQWSALYAFASTGAILESENDDIGRDTREEIFAHRCYVEQEPIPDDINESDRLALIALDVYIKDHGLRGPQSNWSELTW